MLSGQPFIQTQDAIFKPTELRPCLFDRSADPVGKMELLPVLWAHLRYLFLWEGSPEPDSIGAIDRKIFKVVFPNLGLALLRFAPDLRNRSRFALMLRNLIVTSQLTQYR